MEQHFNTSAVSSSSLYTQSQHHQTQPETTSCCYLFVRRLITTLLVLFVMLSFVIGISWTVLHPRPPNFTLTSFSISNFSLSNSYFSSNYDLQLSVQNPNNKITLVIDHIFISVSYKWSPMAKTSIYSPYYLEKMDNGSVSAKLVTSMDMPLKHGKKLLELMRMDYSKGVVSFDLKLMIKTTFRAGIWLTKRRPMDVCCRNLRVKFLSDKGTGKFRGGRASCSAYFHP